MNRDELLEECFGATSEDLPAPKKWLSVTEPDEANPHVVHTRALVGLDYRRVIVRDSIAPGDGMAVATTTVPVAVLFHVCVDPEHRGRGYAGALVRSAHEEAASHRSMLFCVVMTTAGCAPFFEKLGYAHPDGAPDSFLVCQLADEAWPAGSVRTPGDW